MYKNVTIISCKMYFRSTPCSDDVIIIHG